MTTTTRTEYEPTIGLEVHVELATATKLFCSCVNEFGAEPNTHICPVCLGLPGSLPVLNEQRRSRSGAFRSSACSVVAGWGRCFALGIPSSVARSH